MIKINDIKIEQNKFPDNSLFMRLNPWDIDQLTDTIRFEWYYESDSELFTLICAKRHMEQCFTKHIYSLYLPYCPHARMDRVKSPEDVFTLKYFCEVINSLKFDYVLVEDPHSNVCTALLNNVEERNPKANVDKVIKMINDDSLTLFFPDAGAMKRYSSLFDLPFTYGEKTRDWATGAISNLEIKNPELVKDNAVLIVDDICSYGGTFTRAAKALHEAGASAIYLYVTHCEDNIHNGNIFKDGYIDSVYTTNSIYTGKNDNSGGVIVL